ncbi:Na+/H+ antiporter NhaA [Parvularcula sp. IMCC14364]|uniref:Na+/H+ antiporter NhaA n=1 Tax=Parvularcula sp. IMCC14364 TaxID=3067902 RepID=UPI0035578C26
MFNRVGDFLKLEASAGLILMFAAALALLANNSFLSDLYDQLLTTPVAVQIGALVIDKPLLLWINDGLMAIFFFLVGLEIKREVIQGELSSFDKASLPIFAAIGGMAIPALIYAWFNWGSPDTISGWAIPAATDIAFALGILALLGSRVPVVLKVFLLAVAIIDDLGAIAIIALFYTSDLSIIALIIAATGLVALFILNRMGVKRITPYALIGLIIWVSVLKSGVHATLAGVLVAFMIPLHGKDGAQSPLHKLEHDLHPWVAFLVLPIFAFANAGVSFAGLSLDAFLAPVTIGVALGLFFGKQIGVMAFAALAVSLRLAKLPQGVGWKELYGVACLTGVGFTMSLFIGTLAFSDADTLNQVRMGVLAGSIASGIVGFMVLSLSLKEKKVEAAAAQPAL